MVTIIIPNYNHARYLNQRIDSILNQSYSDFRLIILDDCSSDNSRTVIKDYLDRDERISIAFNDVNSGSTFVQWNKGLSLAKSKYVWIAESDDFAHPELLMCLVNIMEKNPDVGLCYCDSIIVDKNSIPLNEVKFIMNKYLSTDNWNKDFIMAGFDFLKKYMMFTNVIPNASAVLLRKEVVDKVGPANVSMRLAGDWLYWSSLLSLTNVAYISAPMNYFRTHSENVRSNTLKNGILIEETSKVMLYIKQLFSNEPYNREAIEEFFRNWRLNFDAGNISVIQSLSVAMNVMKICGVKYALKKLANYTLANGFAGVIKLIKLHKNS